MKTVILPPGDDAKTIPAQAVTAKVAEPIGFLPCPACKGFPWRVKGVTPHVVVATTHRHCTVWEAVTICCGQEGWTIGVEFTSLFGFDEDRAVLEGRARVYL